MEGPTRRTGHRDRANQSLVHDTATLRHHSLRVVLVLAATYRLYIWCGEIAQAYIKGKELSRDIYLHPDQSFGLAKGSLLRILLPLAGLSDANDAWCSTSRHFLTSSLNFQRTTSDACLMYGDSNTRQSLLGVYVDDIVFAGTPDLVRSSHAID